MSLIEGLRIFSQSFRKPAEYSGTPEKICRAIVEECWNGEFFQTSLRNYPVFYARDFSMCVEALLALGYKEKVHKTIRFALKAYRKKKKVTQQVGKNGAFDYPNTPSDALAHFIRTVNISKYSLHETEKEFLRKQVKHYFELLEGNGLLPTDQPFTGMRDHAIRESGCADNTTFAAVQKFGHSLGVAYEERFNYENLLEEFWTDKGFCDDKKNRTITGDANILPLWFDITPKKAKKIIATLEKMNTIPAKYETGRSTKTRWHEVFVPGWEHNTVWLHLGYMYLDIVHKHETKLHKKYVRVYEKIIRENKNHPEVLTAKGKPYRSWAFRSDSTMLWAANFLKHKALIKK